MFKSLFRVGDMVRHASGGSDMLVKGPGNDAGEIWCVWFNGRYYHAGSFPETAVIRSNASPLWKKEFPESTLEITVLT
jgi:uncharacterized protein YodC (DUF2158 family)